MSSQIAPQGIFSNWRGGAVPVDLYGIIILGYQRLLNHMYCKISFRGTVVYDNSYNVIWNYKQQEGEKKIAISHIIYVI